MASSEQSSTSANDKAGDNAHIPFSLRDSLLLMSSSEAYVGNIPTIFIGVVDEDYTEAMWTSHVNRVMKLFQIKAEYYSYNIQVRGEGSDCINAEQMGRDVSEVIEKINKLKLEQNYTFNMIRIAGIGIHNIGGVHTAMEAIVKGWDLEHDKKEIQFIALGDTIQGSYLNFCKSLCLKKVCAKVQFYKTKDYDQFGYLASDLLNDTLTGVQNLAQFMGEMMSDGKLASTLNPSSTENKDTENTESDLFQRLFKDFTPLFKEYKSKMLSARYDQAHIPFSLRDALLVMSSNKGYTGNIPTIFVGVVDDDYTEAMWSKHATRIAQLFRLEIESFSYHVKVKGDEGNSINAEQMGQDILQAIEKINSIKQEHNYSLDLIRIVGMGIHSALGVHIAIETLVKGWNLQWDKKAVQFVALGDSIQGTYFNICKSFCLKKICAQVQFFKTMDYDQFGYYRSDQMNEGFANFMGQMLASKKSK